MKSVIYKGHEIERHLSGWYSAFVLGTGYLKADSVQGVKEMIDKAESETKCHS